jgi:putative ABC transport system permease protein
MPVLSTLKSTAQTLFRSQELDRELDEELQSYLDMLIEEKILAGTDPVQARRQALIELGGNEQVKASVREARHGAVLDSLLNDIRFALRMIRRSPGYAAIVVVTLAIGIGANTALFSTIKALLLSQLPYHEPERLVAASKTYDGIDQGPVSRLDFIDYRRLSHSFDGFCALASAGPIVLSGADRAEAVAGMYVSWNLFQTLGESPIRGRFFTESEEDLTGARLIMISHDLWQGRFGGSEKAIGSSLHLDGVPYQVVGVMRPGFRFLREADVWILIDRGCPVDAERDSHSMTAVGRLKRGVSIRQAQSDVDAAATVLEQEYPDTNTGKGLHLYDLREYMVAHVRPSLNLLMATTGLLLVIACINVAGLQLARGQRRLSELAMRSALGASRRRLIRQLLTESVILTVVAGLFGIGVAFLFHNLLLRLLPPGDPGVPVPTIDGSVLLFALLISVATGVVVGIVPAVRGTSLNVWQKLETSIRSTEAKRSTRLRAAMVVVQVAMSVVLLIGCGLLIRSMVNLTSVELGFDSEGIIGGPYSIQGGDDSTSTERVARFAAVIEGIRTLPGVTNVAAVTKMPIASTTTDWPIWRAEDPRPEPNDSLMALARAATPGYFETIGIPLLRGRDFADADSEGAAPVVIISAAVARDLFADHDPIGRAVKLGWMESPFEVVGIVGNARIDGVRSDFEQAMYLPSAMFGPSFQWLVVRSDGDPALLEEPIRKLVEGMDRNSVLGELVTMESLVDEDLSGFRVVSLALGLLSVVALLLTAVGLYGVLAYHVSQRTNEIGIRFALGASPIKVTGLVMKKGLSMMGIGLALGLLGASMSSRLIQNLLFEIEPLDPIAYLSGALFFAAVAAVACLVPAWRAAGVNPVTALRSE